MVLLRNRAHEEKIEVYLDFEGKKKEEDGMIIALSHSIGQQ